MLYLVAGEAGVGKTGFALFLAYNAARRFGVSVVFHSIAEDRSRIALRLLSMDSVVDAQKMRNGFVDDDEWELISESIGRLMEMPIFIDDTPSLTASGLATNVREAEPQPIGLIVIDYLQLLGSSCRDRAERADELVDIGRELKMLARTLDVPVVVTVQTPPIRVWLQGDYHDLLFMLSKACGAVNDADAVLFMYRDDLQNPATDRRNVVDIIAAKHRHGPTGIACTGLMTACAIWSSSCAAKTRHDCRVVCARRLAGNRITSRLRVFRLFRIDVLTRRVLEIAFRGHCDPGRST